MAAVELELVFEHVEAFIGFLVAAVGEPAIGLQQRGGPEILFFAVLVSVPPV